MASFRKRGSTWQYRIKYTDPYTKVQREVSKGGFKTKKEAQVHAAKEEIRLANGLDVEGASISLEEYMNEWLLVYKKDNVKKNTFILHQRNINTKILPYFKKLALKDLNPARYQKFLNDLNERGYSTRTIEIIHTTMFNAMKTAVYPLKKLDHNPCEHATIPKKNLKRKKGLQYIPSDEISDFLFFARRDSYIYYIFFKVLIDTGMRKGEAAALQREDIDFENSLIHITKSLDFQTREGESLFGETKTFESERSIKMSDSLKKELMEHMEYLDMQKKIFGDGYMSELNLMFCRENGNFLPKSTLFNAFKRVTQKAGLDQMPIHSLRHTHAVLLLESGASMKYIQERLGHKNIAITSDIYSHISEKIEHSSMSNYDEYIQNLLG